MLAGSKELAHRLEAVERTLKRQGHAIAVVYDEVKKLQAPPPTPKLRIGFRPLAWIFTGSGELTFWPVIRLAAGG
jgi:hypothetical protein